MKRYRPVSTDNERLLAVLRSRRPVQVQNGLMKCADREIALALGRMEEEDIASALSRIPQQKARRVREELRYQKRLKNHRSGLRRPALRAPQELHPASRQKAVVRKARLIGRCYLMPTRPV